MEIYNGLKFNNISEQAPFKINELKTKKAVWQLFADVVEVMNERDIVHQETLFQQIVWVNNTIDFHIAPNTLPVAEQFILSNIELFRNVDYSIANYNLLKGKASFVCQSWHSLKWKLPLNLP